MSVNDEENLKKPVIEDPISGDEVVLRDVVEGDEVVSVEQQEVEVDEVQKLEAEVEKWKDLALRHAAELDNYRKRAAREVQEVRTYGNVDLLRSLLPVMDNFDMGLEAARAENEKSMIFMGMSMVKKQLVDFLKDQGVEEVSPVVGDVFDPNLHDAVSQVVSEEVVEGGVLEMKRRGFKLKERLLRPASVVVSGGAGGGEG